MNNVMDLEEFRQWMLDRELSENTIDVYMQSVKQYFSMYPELSKKNMIAYKKVMLEKHKPKTANIRCIGMNQYCKFRNRRDCEIKTIKIHKNLTVENVITREQFEKLLEGLRADGNEKGYWMVKFLGKTGARASEFVRLDKKCLETGVCEMWTKGKIRRILIPDSLIEESREYFEKVDSELLFPSRTTGKQMTTSNINSSLKDWARKYGIPEKVAHAHSFRHLYAVEFLKVNKNIALLADLMGHESVDTTAIYLKLSAEEQRRQFNQACSW